MLRRSMLAALSCVSMLHIIVDAQSFTVLIHNTESESVFNYQLTSHLGESGWAIKRAGHFDYAPSVMKVDSDTVQMWFCGSGGTGATGGDSIFYSRSDSYGQFGTWSTPIEVMRPSNNNAYLDYGHACDPSVSVFNGYYYVMYTGTADWVSQYGPCPTGGDLGCDGRIFVARVPVVGVAIPNSYQKLVNVGECTSPGCFQWKPFWTGLEYPPVPIVREEIGPVWRRIGTGSQGYTVRYTSEYGIGQPSQLSVWDLRIWFTRAMSATEVDVRVWTRPYVDVENPYALQDFGSYAKRISNAGNHVNYDIALDSPRNRYFVTIASPAHTRPRVHAAHEVGFWMPSSDHIISNNLSNQGGLEAAESNTHNSGFLRDQFGYLVTMPGHAGGPEYHWVYYGTDAHQPSPYWDINRVPFTLAP